jgi:hypothetical protein
MKAKTLSLVAAMALAANVGFAQAADHDLNASSGADYIHVSWAAKWSGKYKLCWKKSSKVGNACWYNKRDNITESDVWVGSGYTWYMSIPAECNTEYKVKLKRKGTFGWDTEYVTTSGCGCAIPCPEGGWYDGANCQIGQAPAGTTAFIWGGNYYYSALPSNSCPYPGSWYDGANCYVQAVPSGVTPFIWANHWYYQSCP